MQRVILEPAFVLHSRPYSNTSLVVELLTRRHGRIAALARSARGLKSRYKGKLQAFSPMLISWSGRYELVNLGQVELSSKPYLLEGKHLLSAFYLNELLLRLLQKNDAHIELFDRYEKTLHQLEQGACLQTVLRLFEKNLLIELGYALPLHYEAQTREPINADAHYQFIPERGFLYVQQETVDSTIFSGRSLLALQQEALDSEDILKDVKRLMRTVLNLYLGAKPIKCRELMV